MFLFLRELALLHNKQGKQTYVLSTKVLTYERTIQISTMPQWSSVGGGKNFNAGGVPRGTLQCIRAVLRCAKDVFVNLGSVFSPINLGHPNGRPRYAVGYHINHTLPGLKYSPWAGVLDGSSLGSGFFP